MEPRRENRLDRWFLRVQDQTFGPLPDQQVLLGLKSGEFSGQDKICSANEQYWQPLTEHPHFKGFKFRASRSRDLISPPSPRMLQLCKRVTISEPPPKIEIIMEQAISSIQEYPVPEPTADLPILELAAAIPVPEIIPVSIVAEPMAEIAMPMAAKQEPVEITSRIPPRPDYVPVFIAAPTSWEELKKNAPRKRQVRIFKIELKGPDRPLHFLFIFVAIGLAFAAGNWVENKTRDLKDSRLSDPSSPTTAPFEAGDPIPPLKAPTRPQRE